MGKILAIDNSDENNPVITIKTSKQELDSLKGNLNDTYIFNSTGISLKTNFTKRGTNDSTVYLRIPKNQRQKLKGSALISRIDLEDRVIFGVEMRKK